jgi:hypothetical protein
LVTANVQSVGGAALFNRVTQKWAAFLPENLKRKDLSRIDFDGFAVTSTGTFAMFQDGGPKDTVISRLAPGETVWKEVMRGESDSMSAQFKKLTVGRMFNKEYENAQFVKGVSNISVNVDNQQKTVPIDAKGYYALVKYGDKAYYAISSVGFEELTAQDALPRVLTTEFAGGNIDRLLLSPDGQYVIGSTINQNDFDGSIVSIQVMGYDPTHPELGVWTQKIQPNAKMVGSEGKANLEKVDQDTLRLWQPEIGAVLINTKTHEVKMEPIK